MNIIYRLKDCFSKKPDVIIPTFPYIKTREVKPKHSSSSVPCEKCMEIIDMYPNFNQEVLSWWLMIQSMYPSAHISCAGRGKKEQERVYNAKLSLARWGQSAHNWNCAIDIFELRDGKAVWDELWFDKVIRSNIPYNLKWYGSPNARFRELPHVELNGWANLINTLQIKLVE